MMEKVIHIRGRTEGAVDGEPVLELWNLEKTFGGERALDGVSLTVRSGEIHGLLGQNGSGKSTLIKILAGFHAPDPGGRLSISGVDVPLPLSPGQFHTLGMRFVHQDLGLISSLTVLENLMIEDLSSKREWSISWRKARAKARQLFERFGLDLDPLQQVSELRPVHRAQLAIVRAVSSMPASTDTSRGLLVLDEPTVYLPKDDTQLLFDLTRRVAQTGAGVLFVSHDIDEVMELTDRVTVLRDGRIVGTASTLDSSAGDIVEMIVGRKFAPAARGSVNTARDDKPILRIDDLAGGAVESTTIEITHGEILGVTGLSGSGFEDLPYLLFGVGKAKSGTFHFGDQALQLQGLTPASAFRAGLALVPADRQRDGAVLSLSVLDNVSMQVLDKFQRGPFLNRARLSNEVRTVLNRFDVRPADPNLTCSSLSGGNQQKVLMAKWLQTRPSVLLIHEPTQGVDIGAREEIFAVLRSAAAEGTTILCASSDHEQLALLCDRVLIFARGRISAELTGDQITKETISELCYSAPTALDRSA
jgi:ribose transport system ATP-binding protein